MSNEYYESNRQRAAKLTPEQQAQVDEMLRQQGFDENGMRPDDPDATFDGVYSRDRYVACVCARRGQREEDGAPPNPILASCCHRHGRCRCRRHRRRRRRRCHHLTAATIFSFARHRHRRRCTGLHAGRYGKTMNFYLYAVLCWVGFVTFFTIFVCWYTESVERKRRKAR